jgi:putative transposase
MFFGDKDREFFLRCLRNASVAERCDVHAFVLMTNHVHLLATAQVDRGLSCMMQSAGRRFVENVNLIHGRTGTLLEGRFKSRPVLTYPYALACIRYVEQNPVRAGMVPRASDYPWSSCRHHMGWFVDPMVSEHGAYLALAKTPGRRAEIYSGLCEVPLSSDLLETVRATPPRGRPRALGNGI